MNQTPYLLVKWLDRAITGGHDRSIVDAAERALSAHLGNAPQHDQAHRLRVRMERHAAHRCDFGCVPHGCHSLAALNVVRRTVLRRGIAPGHPVAAVSFFPGSGTVTVMRLGVDACGAPRGAGVFGRFGISRPLAVRGSVCCADGAAARLSAGGWTLVTRSQAPVFLRSAGFNVCEEPTHPRGKHSLMWSGGDVGGYRWQSLGPGMAMTGVVVRTEVHASFRAVADLLAA